jgi:oligoribonuclease NrnB/cAMP/cGMP phosphodiesterase (DHH superfamily)
MQNLIIHEDTCPPSAFKYIVYHAHCVDGLTAAAIAMDWDKAYKMYEFIPMDAGSLPEFIRTLKNGAVLFLDVAPKKHEYDELISNGNQVLIIDHHKTSIEELAYIHEADKIMAINASGAMLAFMYFYGNEAWAVKDAVELCSSDRYKTMHDFVYMVQENDLFNFDRKPVLQIFDAPDYSSKHLFSGICHYINPIQHSNLKIAMVLSYMFDFQHILEKGKELAIEDDAYIKSITDKAVLLCTKGFRFMFVKAETFRLCSQIGEKLLKDHTNADFSMLIYPAVNQSGTVECRVSLRSLGKFDVSEFAKKFKGGGHAMAAGFTVTKEDSETIINRILSEDMPSSNTAAQV